MLAVEPLSITAFLMSPNELVSIGYIVWTDSDRLTSSILLILSEPTVTRISTGVPLRISEDVYTPGEYVAVLALFCLLVVLAGLLSGSFTESIYIVAIMINAAIMHIVIISFLSGMTNILVGPLIRLILLCRILFVRIYDA